MRRLRCNVLKRNPFDIAKSGVDFVCRFGISFGPCMKMPNFEYRSVLYMNPIGFEPPSNEFELVSSSIITEKEWPGECLVYNTKSKYARKSAPYGSSCEDFGTIQELSPRAILRQYFDSGILTNSPVHSFSGFSVFMNLTFFSWLPESSIFMWRNLLLNEVKLEEYANWYMDKTNNILQIKIFYITQQNSFRNQKNATKQPEHEAPNKWSIHSCVGMLFPEN